MQVIELDEWVKNWWNKIDNVDKKSFWIFFICMNVVFLYNSVFCLFGKDDISFVFSNIDPFLALICGRYSSTWIEYIISNKTIIPFFANQIVFLFLSISTILTLKWFDLKKTLFNYVFAGLFLILTPFIYLYFWYRCIIVGFLLIPFFLIVSFFLCMRIEKETFLLKKFIYFFVPLFLLTVFCLGCYQPIVSVICGLLISKIFIDYIDNDFLDFRVIIWKYRYIFFVFFISLLLTFYLLYYFRLKGYIGDVHSTQLTQISEIPKYFLPFLCETINRYINVSYPYICILYKHFLAIFLLLSFVSVITFVNKRKPNLKVLMKQIFITILFFCFILYAFNIIYLFSPFLMNNTSLNPVQLRLEYWTSVYFYFVCIVIALKYSNVNIKNLLYILLIIQTIVNVQINMHIQKDHLFAQQIEFLKIMTLKNIIFSNVNYKNNEEKKYEFMQIGTFQPFGISEFYHSNKFTISELNELYSTFLCEGNLYFALVKIPPKITNINCRKNNLFFSFEQLKKEIDVNLKNWLLNEARAYPSPNCTFIDNDIIYIVLDQNILESIKEELNKKD